MKKLSAGILLYRKVRGKMEFFLVHPGGPFWKNKEDGAWTIPKGEPGDDEDGLSAAVREFREETGTLLKGPFEALTPVKQKGGKMVLAWATEGELDPGGIVSNTFEIEWPPRSGKMKKFPEVDRGAWFAMEDAMRMINPAQARLLEEMRGR